MCRMQRRETGKNKVLRDIRAIYSITPETALKSFQPYNPTK